MAISFCFKKLAAYLWLMMVSPSHLQLIRRMLCFSPEKPPNSRKLFIWVWVNLTSRCSCHIGDMLLRTVAIRICSAETFAVGGGIYVCVQMWVKETTKEMFIRHLKSNIQLEALNQNDTWGLPAEKSLHGRDRIKTIGKYLWGLSEYCGLSALKQSLDQRWG